MIVQLFPSHLNRWHHSLLVNQNNQVIILKVIISMVTPQGSLNNKKKRTTECTNSKCSKKEIQMGVLLRSRDETFGNPLRILRAPFLKFAQRLYPKSKRSEHLKQLKKYKRQNTCRIFGKNWGKRREPYLVWRRIRKGFAVALSNLLKSFSFKEIQFFCAELPFVIHFHFLWTHSATNTNNQKRFFLTLTNNLIGFNKYAFRNEDQGR